MLFFQIILSTTIIIGGIAPHVQYHGDVLSSNREKRDVHSHTASEPNTAKLDDEHIAEALEFEKKYGKEAHIKIKKKNYFHGVSFTAALDKESCYVSTFYLPLNSNLTCYDVNFEVEFFCGKVFSTGYITQIVPVSDMSHFALAAKQLKSTNCQQIKM